MSEGTENGTPPAIFPRLSGPAVSEPTCHPELRKLSGRRTSQLQSAHSDYEKPSTATVRSLSALRRLGMTKANTVWRARWKAFRQPIAEEKARVLKERWDSLPAELRTDNQIAGRHLAHCGFTLGASYCSFLWAS